MVRQSSFVKVFSLLSLTFLLSFPAEAGAVNFNYPSFKEALNYQYTQFEPYFRNNYLFDLEYSEGLADRFVAWNEDDRHHIFEVEEFLRDSQLVEALKNAASDFARKEYSFRNRKKRKTPSGVEFSSNEREKMPFSEEDTLFRQSYASVWPEVTDGEELEGVSSYRMTFAAGWQFPERSPLYPVHQAGRAVFGIDRTAIILTVFADYFHIRDGIRSSEKVNTNPTIYWLVLPSWKKVARQGSEDAAAYYVADNVKVWLPPLK